MKIVIIGNGGHSKVIRDIIHSVKNAEVVACLDDKYERLTMIDDMLTGPIRSAEQVHQKFQNTKFIVAIGNNHVRKWIVKQLNLPKQCYITLQHSTSWVSPSAKVGHGSVIMAHSVVNSDSEIGDHSIINTRSVIEHDTRLGKFVHVSPSVTLTGAVKVGEGAHIGAGATVIPNIDIGEWSVIGAGATVINPIPSYCTAVGVPARVKNKKVREGV